MEARTSDLQLFDHSMESLTESDMKYGNDRQDSIVPPDVEHFDDSLKSDMLHSVDPKDSTEGLNLQHSPDDHEYPKEGLNLQHSNDDGEDSKEGLNLQQGLDLLQHSNDSGELLDADVEEAKSLGGERLPAGDGGGGPRGQQTHDSASPRRRSAAAVHGAQSGGASSGGRSGNAERTSGEHVGEVPSTSFRGLAAGGEHDNGLPAREQPVGLEGTSTRETVEVPARKFLVDQSPSNSYLRGSSRRLKAASSPGETRRTSASGDDGQMVAPPTPNRSRHRTISGSSSVREEGPKAKSVGLPRFGAWNREDSESVDNITLIFNNAREEKKIGGPVDLSPASEPNDADLYEPSGPIRQAQSVKKSWFCFGNPDVKP